MKLKNPIILKDALGNCSERNHRDMHDWRYGRGVLVGAVSAIMALHGCDFAEAFKLIKDQLPADTAEHTIPEGWE